MRDNDSYTPSPTRDERTFYRIVDTILNASAYSLGPRRLHTIRRLLRRKEAFEDPETREKVYKVFRDLLDRAVGLTRS